MIERLRVPAQLRYLTRFIVTGLAATGIHVGVAMSLLALLRIQPYTANMFAFLTATVFSYAINTRWSFSDTLGKRTLVRYSIVALLGCAGTVAISAGAQQAGLSNRIGIVLVVLLVTPVTFFLHRFWTYAKRVGRPAGGSDGVILFSSVNPGSNNDPV